jgi:hypothetical protein
MLAGRWGPLMAEHPLLPTHPPSPAWNQTNIHAESLLYSVMVRFKCDYVHSYVEEKGFHLLQFPTGLCHSGQLGTGIHTTFFFLHRCYCSSRHNDQRYIPQQSTVLAVKMQLIQFQILCEFLHQRKCQIFSHFLWNNLLLIWILQLIHI